MWEGPDRSTRHGMGDTGRWTVVSIASATAESPSTSQYSPHVPLCERRDSLHVNNRFPPYPKLIPQVKIREFPDVITLYFPRRRALIGPAKIHSIRRKEGMAAVSPHPVATHRTFLESKPRDSVTGHHIHESPFGLQIATAGEEGRIYFRELHRGLQAAN